MKKKEIQYVRLFFSSSFFVLFGVVRFTTSVVLDCCVFYV